MHLLVRTFLFLIVCVTGALAHAGLKHMGWDFTLGMFTAIVILQFASYMKNGHLLDIL